MEQLTEDWTIQVEQKDVTIRLNQRMEQKNETLVWNSMM